MLITLSDPMRRAIETTLRSKAGESRIVNVFGVAEEVQLRFIDDNVALEDIAAVVAHLAAQSGCALELDRGNFS
ncbi:conserved hypothetical protein [Bosea sp. 62]|uniref:hypothetical protein n=1 Tax=unclassified Bosea (in: a-proteobacteria) TaxID=2653178 RepID=UPI00125A1C75|nr:MULTISPECIES: hypothetical protein [unclassified Bosea (in: a-proteobacteria)]CAD5249699.1 conserved hypothetical protein [Bosea sp. 7B]CAD5282805.1 conserved hypothetical protein [Bosea sp. 21B]CAD5285458.1 conserved hypothetical protein [Bosea sp. 46]VVT62288.1 conserved hypothetical protein [Bosea sp. EC-HK365B]VXB20418.1 conserved hypothetical protein [Bosea sp. 62]